MSKQANKPQSAPIHKEPPEEQIRELAKTFPDCLLTLKRRNSKMQWGSLGLSDIPFKTLDLLAIDKFIDERGIGGGTYCVDARNPNGDEPYYIVRFEFFREGNPLSPRYGTSGFGPPGVGGAPLPFAMPGMGPPVPGVPMPPGIPGAQVPSTAWAKGLPPHEQNAFMESQMRAYGYPYGYPFTPAAPPGATTTSDQVLMRELSELRSELGSLRSELKEKNGRLEQLQHDNTAKLEEMRREGERRERELREQHARDLAAERERREEDRRRHDEEKRREEQDRRDRERADLERRISESKENKGDRFLEMMMLMFKDSKEKSASDMQVQMKLAEMSSSSSKEMFNAIIQMQNAGKSTDAIMLEMLRQKSPDAQAELIGTMMNSQMTMVGAMMNLVQAVAGEEQPPWLQMAMQGMESVRNIAGAIIQSKMAAQEDAAPVPVRRLPAQTNERALPPPKSSLMGTMELEEAPPVSLTPIGATPPPEAVAELVEPAHEEAEAEITPEAVASAVETDLDNPDREAVEAEVHRMMDLLPIAFRTDEWRTILVELHLQSPVDVMADLITSHIEHLIRFSRLPSALSGLRKDPEGTLSSVFAWLPIRGKAPEYVDEIINAVVQFLVEDRFADPPQVSNGASLQAQA